MDKENLSPPRASTVEELSDKNFLTQIQGCDLAVVDVYASWCGTCRIFAPHFERVATQHPHYSFFKIDAEANPDFAQSLNMDNLPYVAVYFKGKFVGGKATSKIEQLEQMLEVVQKKLGA